MAELAQREGHAPVELLRREMETLLAAHRMEAELKERAKRRDDLLRMRRRLRASIQTRESELNADRRELGEIERELAAIRLPPGLKLTDE